MKRKNGRPLKVEGDGKQLTKKFLEELLRDVAFDKKEIPGVVCYEENANYRAVKIDFDKFHVYLKSIEEEKGIRCPNKVSSLKEHFTKKRTKDSSLLFSKLNELVENVYTHHKWERPISVNALIPEPPIPGTITTMLPGNYVGPLPHMLRNEVFNDNLIPKPSNAATTTTLRHYEVPRNEAFDDYLNGKVPRNEASDDYNGEVTRNEASNDYNGEVPRNEAFDDYLNGEVTRNNSDEQGEASDDYNGEVTRNEASNDYNGEVPRNEASDYYNGEVPRNEACDDYNGEVTIYDFIEQGEAFDYYNGEVPRNEASDDYNGEVTRNEAFDDFNGEVPRNEAFDYNGEVTRYDFIEQGETFDYNGEVTRYDFIEQGETFDDYNCEVTRNEAFDDYNGDFIEQGEAFDDYDEGFFEDLP